MNDSTHEGTSAQDTVGIGLALKVARREAGLTPLEVAAATRIRPAVLLRFEADDFSGCGGDVYARGRLRKIAEAVGLDPAPLLAEYDARTAAAAAAGRPAILAHELDATAPSAAQLVVRPRARLDRPARLRSGSVGRGRTRITRDLCHSRTLVSRDPPHAPQAPPAGQSDRRDADDGVRAQRGRLGGTGRSPGRAGLGRDRRRRGCGRRPGQHVRFRRGREEGQHRHPAGRRRPQGRRASAGRRRRGLPCRAVRRRTRRGAARGRRGARFRRLRRDRRAARGGDARAQAHLARPTRPADPAADHAGGAARRGRRRRRRGARARARQRAARPAPTSRGRPRRAVEARLGLRPPLQLLRDPVLPWIVPVPSAR